MQFNSFIFFLLLNISFISASDLSFAFEGDEVKRERLKDLQGAKIPPELKLKSWLNSKALSLKDLKGKVVVLDFWATWCGPCISSIPKNNEIAKKYKDQVVFIGVCHSRGAEKMKEVVMNRNIEYPVAIDPDNKTISAYKVNGYPDYYIIGKDGSLVVADCANSKVSDVLEKLLR